MDQAAEQSTRAGVVFWLGLFVGCLVLSIALAAAPWIPEWEPFVQIVVVGLVLGAGAFAVLVMRTGRHHVRTRVAVKWRLLVNVLGALVVALGWCFVALLVGVATVGFPFGATYHSKFEFPQYDTTLYLYDSSFLDPETAVFLRQGLLPFRERVDLRFGIPPEDVDVVQHGSLLLIEDQELDLNERR